MNREIVYEWRKTAMSNAAMNRDARTICAALGIEIEMTDLMKNDLRRWHGDDAIIFVAIWGKNGKVYRYGFERGKNKMTFREARSKQ